MKNKITFKSIAIILIIAILLCIFPSKTFAAIDGEKIVGTIFTPVRWLVCGISDIAMNAIHYIIYGENAIEDGTINLKITPEAIFSNEVELLDANFFSPKSSESTAGQISATLARWYVALRDIGLVGLLSVLAYIGLKTMLSSSAASKAKYKQLLVDWIIALILIFFMHYIISFCVNIAEIITKSLAAASDGGITASVRVEIANRVNNGELYYAMGYTLIYAVLVIYTYMFLFKYIRRIINLAFLTVVSPLVAFSYPIDKAGDSKAQAFGVWFKEYITNLILQPMHLIIYTILLGSVTDLANTNLLYAIVALGFVAEAEKIIRKMFGIESESVDNGSFVGGAVVMNGINSIMKRVKRVKGGNKSAKDENAENSKVRYNNRTADNPDEQNEFLMSPFSKAKQAEQENTEQGNTEQEKQENENTTKVTEDMTNKAKQMAIDGKKVEEQKEANDIRMKNGVDSNSGKPKKKLGLKKAKALGKMGGRFLLKGAGKAAKAYVAASTATAMGMIGVAAGLASDDYSNVFKYGSAAAAGGALMGKTGVDKAVKLPGQVLDGARNIKDEYIKNRFEDDTEGYKQYMNAQSDKEFLKNKEIKQMYKDAYGDRSEEAMQAALEYRKRGITDNETILKAMSLRGAGDDFADDRKIWAALVASKEQDLDKLEERLVKTKGQDKKEVAKLVDLARNLRGTI